MARSEAAGWALGVLALAITSAAAFGFGARHVELNLGPGDTPFVSGFQEEIDVDNKVGWHWTTYDAGIALPFEAAGVSLATTLRYARMFGEEAVVNVRVGQVAAEAFRARGGETRTTTLSSPGVSGPLTVAIKVDSHERRNMGLRLDRIAMAVESGEPLKLQAAAALRPVAPPEEAPAPALFPRTDESIGQPVAWDDTWAATGRFRGETSELSFWQISPLS